MTFWEALDASAPLRLLVVAVAIEVATVLFVVAMMAYHFIRGRMR